MTPEEQYIEAIIKPLLAYPQDYICFRTVDDKGVLLRVNVHQSDMGRVIGKEGNTAKAIRTLMRQFGGANKAVIHLKISEPQG